MSDRWVLTPNVYVISYSAYKPMEFWRFADDHNLPRFMSDASQDADAIPEIVGRLCYLSYSNPRPGGNEAYLRHIVESGHGRVLEHSNIGLLVSGVSRSLSHQMLTHKVGVSHTELSQRYVDASDVRFVVPPEIADVGESPQRSTFELSCLRALQDYRTLLSDIDKDIPDDVKGTKRKKLAREAARSVLPLATETMYVMTGNLRAWRHFVELRTSPDADREIRRLAYVVFLILKEYAPNTFGDYFTITNRTYPPTVGTPNRKV